MAYLLVLSLFSVLCEVCHIKVALCFMITLREYKTMMRFTWKNGISFTCSFFTLYRERVRMSLYTGSSGVVSLYTTVTGPLSYLIMGPIYRDIVIGCSCLFPHLVPGVRLSLILYRD